MKARLPLIMHAQVARPAAARSAWRYLRSCSRRLNASRPAKRLLLSACRTASPRPQGFALFVAAGLACVLGCVLLAQGIYIHVKAIVAQVLLERAFMQSVETGSAVKPWSWADTWPVARVSVPRLGARSIVLEGSSGQALAFGPGRLPGSAVAGEPGTAVYAAHRDTHFAFLGRVEKGDAIVVTRADGREVSFEVTGIGVVSWDQSGIDVHASGRNLVLATCWPLDARTAGPLRYVVHAQMVDGGVQRNEPTGR